MNEQSNLKQSLSDFQIISKVFCWQASSLNFNVLISDKSFLGIISFNTLHVVKNLVNGNPHDDLAKRGVKLTADYLSSAKLEKSFQNNLQVVEASRKNQSQLQAKKNVSSAPFNLLPDNAQ